MFRACPRSFVPSFSWISIAAGLALSAAPVLSAPRSPAKTVTRLPSLIAFSSDSPIGVLTVEPGNPNSIETLYLHPESGRFAKKPSWSPNGRRLAVTIDGSFYDDDLLIVDREGNVVSTLIEGRGVSFTAWSPDGARIAYQCEIDNAPRLGRWEICIIDVSTGESRILTDPNDDFMLGDPTAEITTKISWHPSGDRIAYSYLRECQGGGSECSVRGIAVADAVTGASTDITGNTGIRQQYPEYSPDGTKVVYHEDVSNTEGIIVANSDFSSPQLIVDDEDLKLSNQSTGIPQPSWSPDSTQIVFASSGLDATFAVRDLFIVGSDGTGITKTTSTSSTESDPSWAQSIVGCTIEGTEGADTLKGTAKADVICGFSGDDKIDGKGGNDIIFGGAGNDTLKGGAGNDTLEGEDGDDILVGGTGRDKLNGGNGVDTLRAKDGAKGDKLDGGAEKDKCSADKGDKRKACP